MNFKKLLLELRWWGNRDDVDSDLSYLCEDAEEAIVATERLCEAIDNYTKEPNARNWTEVLLARKELR